MLAVGVVCFSLHLKLMKCDKNKSLVQLFKSSVTLRYPHVWSNATSQLVWPSSVNIGWAQGEAKEQTKTRNTIKEGPYWSYILFYACPGTVYELCLPLTRQ